MEAALFILKTMEGQMRFSFIVYGETRPDVISTAARCSQRWCAQSEVPLEQTPPLFFPSTVQGRQGSKPINWRIAARAIAKPNVNDDGGSMHVRVTSRKTVSERAPPQASPHSPKPDHPVGPWLGKQLLTRGPSDAAHADAYYLVELSDLDGRIEEIDLVLATNRQEAMGIYLNTRELLPAGWTASVRYCPNAYPADEI